jgi:hypothetical protein
VNTDTDLGKITVICQVVCGHCAAVEHPPGADLKDARFLLLRDYEWTLTVDYGWVCTECARKLGKLADPLFEE